MLDPTLQQLIERIHAAAPKLVLEFAGAGSLALFWLHSVPGSSRTILEATDRYAPTALADLIGHVPEKFVDRATAVAMAAQAYRRAMRLADAMTSCLGVACTATIATDRVKRGDHGCWVALRDRAGVRTYGLVLLKGARDRQGEETVVSQVLVRAIAEGCQLNQAAPVELVHGERLDVSYSADPDPIAQLLEGAAGSVTVARDGTPAQGVPLSGGLLSGSFNPLHIGHERLAAAAAAALGQPVTFELPILNADKAPLGYAEIERRLAQFRWRYPVVLSRAALFVDKAALFPGCVFVVGYDTAARLVEPRYYGGAAARDAALEAIRGHGCRFLVAGREQDGSFHMLDDIPIPESARDLFSGLPEAAFRVDLSSSEIRARLDANRQPVKG